MMNFILGGAGTGKSAEMIARITKSVDCGRSCIVIVPDQFSFEYDKKLYGELGAVRYNSLAALSFQRVSEDIFRRFGGKKGTYAGTPSKLALTYLSVKRVKENDGLLFYERQSSSGGFVSAVSEVIKELHWSGVSSEELAERIAMLDGTTADKASDISNIYSSYLNLLDEHGMKDSLFDIAAAAAVAGKNGYFSGADVYIDEFQSFSADELRMLDAMTAVADVTVSLSTEDINSRLPLFSIVNATYHSLTEIAEKYNVKTKVTMLSEPHRFATDDLAVVSGNIFRTKRKHGGKSSAVCLVESSDVYNEADYVCTEIKRLVRNGMRYSDIAVLTRNVSRYYGILEGAFDRYEIPFFMDMNKPVMHKSVMLFITSALEYASRKTPSTETVLKYAKTGLLGIEPQELALLDNYVYRYSIDGDLWLSDFPDTDTDINELRKGIIEPLENFRRSVHSADGRQICEELYRLFTVSGAEKSLCVSDILDAEVLEVSREQKQLWNMLVSVLDEMYNVLGEEKMTVSDFAELFRIIVSESRFANPPQTLDAVTVAGIERARLAAPKAVFVIGANDGDFPSAVKSSGLFDDRDRAVLSKAGISLEMDTEYKLNEERFICYKALSSPSEKLYVSYPLADAAGASCYPSYVVSRISELFDNDILVRSGGLGALFFSVTKKSAYYNYVQGFDKTDSDFATLREYLLSDEEYAAKVRFLDRVTLDAKESLTNRETAKKLFGDKLYVSPSRFEDFQKCPFMYFCKKGLSLNPLKKIEIDPSETGTIVHNCLYDIFTSLDRDSFVSAERDMLSGLVSASFEKYFNAKLGGSFAKSERFILTYEAIKDTVMDILVHIQEEFSQSEFYPSDFELEIKHGGKAKPHIVKTPDGIEISFTGTVDRVDTYSDGERTYIRVVDYKTGNKKFSLDDVYYGLNMQMLMYLFTLTDGQSGKYRDSLPAGVLYMPSREADAALDRNADEALVEDERSKAFKMSGIVVDDEKIITAMEKDVGGVYIPVSLTKTGYSKRSQLITYDRLERLRKYADRLVKSMAGKLYNGEVEAYPLVKGKKKPCAYCDYWSICGKSDTTVVREYAKNTGELMEKILNGGDNDD